MPKKSPILLITAILGALAIGGVVLFSLAPSGPAQPAGTPVPTATPTPSQVFVANRDIPPRTVVTAAMLRRSSVTGEAPADSIQSLDQIRGQLTNSSILAGETVTLTSFEPKLRRIKPANFEIPSGFRAVSIYTDIDSTLAGLVDVDDRVDVIATHRLRIEKDGNQLVQGATEYTAGRLLGRNLRVLAVDDSIKAPVPTPTPIPGQLPAQAPGTLPAGGPTPAPPPAGPQGPVTKIRVILAADPVLATRIVAAADQGQITLLLRNPNDADAASIAEQREYPSRVVSKREITNTARSMGQAMGEGLSQGMGLRENFTAPPPVVVIPTPVPPPAPPFDPNMGTPQIAPTPSPQEITVIRGTEKTRVLVPQR